MGGWDRYLEASALGSREQCLWVRYEDLIADLRGQIARIATFLGFAESTAPPGGLVLCEAALDSIAATSEFGAMKELFARRNALKDACGKKFDPLHIRNGVVGGWAEVMSPEQSDAFCARTASCGAPVWT